MRIERIMDAAAVSAAAVTLAEVARRRIYG